MQKALSLEHNLTAPYSSQSWEGWLVPWEVQSFKKDFDSAESNGGLFDLSSYACVGLQGKDARDYLQRMSTVNFKTWKEGQLASGAFLTGRGQVIALGDFLAKDSGFLFVTTPGQREKTLEHIEKFHFAEEFTLQDRSSEFAILAIQHPEKTTLAFSHKLTPGPVHRLSWEGIAFFAWKDGRRDLVWLLMDRGSAPDFLKKATTTTPLLGQRLFEYYRILAGLPKVGTEISEKEIILEGALDDFVARNKGCYPGQEVVERIYTYGQVNKKLLRVSAEISSASLPSVPFAILSGERPVANVVALEHVPNSPSQAIGLAYVNKAFWSSSEAFTVGDGAVIHIKA